MKTMILSLALITPAVAHAAEVPECRVRVLRAVADEDGNRWEAGTFADADFTRHDEKGVAYCEDHGLCVPARVDGREAARLVDCHPGRSISPGYYQLDPDPGRFGAARAKVFLTARRVADWLSRRGFSNAGIGSWSSEYAIDPGSPDGRLVARALGGSQSALAAMKAKLQ